MTSLLVTGMISRGGGLYRYSGGKLRHIENTPSMGLTRLDGRLYRMRFSHLDAVLDLLSDNTMTILQSWVIPGASHPHGIVAHRGMLAIADTHHDRVLWFDPWKGEIADSHQVTDLGDAWHINTLYNHNGRLLATCFGRFDEDRGWWGRGPDRRGELIDVETGETLLEGLAAPHSPRPYGEGWLILNTFEGNLSYVRNDGKRLRDFYVGGWPCGLYLDGGVAWVGIGDGMRRGGQLPPHGNSPGKLIGIRISSLGVDLAAWRAIDEVVVPCPAVYEVVAE